MRVNWQQQEINYWSFKSKIQCFKSKNHKEEKKNDSKGSSIIVRR